MRCYPFLAALIALACLACAASADQPSPLQAPQSLAFLPVEKIVTLKEAAPIYDRPAGTAIFRVRLQGRLTARAVSKDGEWWEVALPNGSVGYVSTYSLVTQP